MQPDITGHKYHTWHCQVTYQQMKRWYLRPRHTKVRSSAEKRSCRVTSSISLCHLCQSAMWHFSTKSTINTGFFYIFLYLFHLAQWHKWHKVACRSSLLSIKIPRLMNRTKHIKEVFYKFKAPNEDEKHKWRKIISKDLAYFGII